MENGLPTERIRYHRDVAGHNVILDSNRMSDPQSWVRHSQHQSTHGVGELALVTIRMCFDELFGVEVKALTWRWGMAVDRDA